MAITDYTHALVRRVPRCYAPAYAPRGIAVDARLADAQHAAYAKALESAGVRVATISGDEAFYDSVFVEDTAVVWLDHALITRMTSHREGEQRGVIAALSPSHTLSPLAAGSCLEGGDVLHTEDVTYVGLTARTNQRGADELSEFLAHFGRRVVAVPVSGTLHLKSVVTYPGNRTLLVTPGHVDLRHFEADVIVETAPGEPGAGNCVRVRETVLAPAGYPATLERLRRVAETHSVLIVPLELSEFAKGDGAATCLSLLWHVGTAV
jgi:dimethylargininase